MIGIDLEQVYSYYFVAFFGYIFTDQSTNSYWWKHCQGDGEEGNGARFGK